MKKGLLWLIIIAMVMGLMLGSAVAFAQAPAPVQFQSLTSFDNLFDGIRLFFTDILKRWLVIGLSFSSVWFAVHCAKKMLADRSEKIKVECQECFTATTDQPNKEKEMGGVVCLSDNECFGLEEKSCRKNCQRINSGLDDEPDVANRSQESSW